MKNNEKQEKQIVEIKQRVGGNIRATRVMGNMSIEEFSLRLNIPLDKVVDIEEGYEDIRLDMLLEIAEILDVSPGKLVDGETPLM